MGGSQSTRKVIVEDANGEGVVRISEDVVRRIRGLPEGSSSSYSDSAKFKPKKDAESPLQKEDHYRMVNKEIEDFYNEKLNDLHRRNNALQEKTNEQFSTAVQEVEKKFLNYTSSPICQELQHQVLQCYQSNPSETLNCSALVTAFTTCVERARISASINRPQSTPPEVTPVS